METIAIVGGGIAGLSSAYFLLQQAQAQKRPLRLHVLEASDRWGGVIRTVREDGFVVEGGPDSVLAFKPAGVELWKALGLASEIVGTVPGRRAFIYFQGRLHPLPEGLTLMIPARLGPLFRTSLLSPRGKMRAAWNLVMRTRTPPGQDVSVADFVTRHLGREVFEHIVEPLFAGIYAGDARQLSLRATYPQLLDLEQTYGSLLRGLLHRVRQQRAAAQRRGRPASAFVTLRGGLALMVEALVAHLQGRASLHLRSRVRTLQPRKGGWRLHLADGSTLEADGVVLALPAHAAARVVETFDPELAGLLAGIPYASSVIVNVALKREDVAHPLEGSGFVVPRVEGRPLLACSWTSSKFPHRAPQGFVLLRCFFGRAGADDVVNWPEEDILALTRRELRETMGITAAPVRTWVFRWRPALPQYPVGHLERVEAIFSRAGQWPHLFLVGNAYRGVGIPDVIAGARRVAEAFDVHQGADDT